MIIKNLKEYIKFINKSAALVDNEYLNVEATISENPKSELSEDEQLFEFNLYQRSEECFLWLADQLKTKDDLFELVYGIKNKDDCCLLIDDLITILETKSAKGDSSKLDHIYQLIDSFTVDDLDNLGKNSQGTLTEFFLEKSFLLSQLIYEHPGNFYKLYAYLKDTPLESVFMENFLDSMSSSLTKIQSAEGEPGEDNNTIEQQIIEDTVTNLKRKQSNSFDEISTKKSKLNPHKEEINQEKGVSSTHQPDPTRSYLLLSASQYHADIKCMLGEIFIGLMNSSIREDNQQSQIQYSLESKQVLEQFFSLLNIIHHVAKSNRMTEWFYNDISIMLLDALIDQKYEMSSQLKIAIQGAQDAQIFNKSVYLIGPNSKPMSFNYQVLAEILALEFRERISQPKNQILFGKLLFNMIDKKLGRDTHTFTDDELTNPISFLIKAILELDKLNENLKKLPLKI